MKTHFCSKISFVSQKDLKREEVFPGAICLWPDLPPQTPVLTINVLTRNVLTLSATVVRPEHQQQLVADQID